MSNIMQSLWIGPKLSNMEKLSMQSFIDNGHEYHLYTYGEVDGIPDGVIIKDGNEILDKSIKVVKSNRGGRITYHGPGQKVVYFVLNLNKREKDIRKLLNNLESCIIDILKEYKVNSYPDKKNIGIWVGDLNKQKKIAAIGIKVKKWIAYHGFSLNISNNLDLYNKIVPCGIKNKGIINLKEIGISNFNNIEKVIVNKFLNIFL